MEIYANVEVTEDNKAGSSKEEDLYEDIYLNEDSMETKRPRSFNPQSEGSGINHTGNKCYRLIAVCVLMLCVLLLTAITVPWIKFNNVKTEKYQLLASYNTLSKEKDQLQTSYNTLNMERDQLQTSYNTLTKEKGQLQIRYNTLTTERDQLQTSYNTLTKEKDQLQANYNNVTSETNQLQTRYNNLTKEKQQLQTNYNILTSERDQLQISCNTLSTERDWLLTSYSTQTTDKNQLLISHNTMDSRLEWRYFNSRSYYISTQKKTWDESRRDCIDKGADLVMINSREEQEFILKQLGYRGRGWIGLNDNDTEGTWKWVNGTLLMTGYWDKGEPNNEGNEDCAEIFTTPNKTGWNDMACTYKNSWVCEKKY